MAIKDIPKSRFLMFYSVFVLGVWPFLSLKGRKVYGPECLALQGLYISDEELEDAGELSDCLLHDLAGNAFSVHSLSLVVTVALSVISWVFRTEVDEVEWSYDAPSKRRRAGGSSSRSQADGC